MLDEGVRAVSENSFENIISLRWSTNCKMRTIHCIKNGQNPHYFKIIPSVLCLCPFLYFVCRKINYEHFPCSEMEAVLFWYYHNCSVCTDVLMCSTWLNT